MNDYYDLKLKQARLDKLQTHENFTFQEIDIANSEELRVAFTSFQPKKVVNLAAQAGVRHSIEHPYVYLDSNLIGFINVIELCRHNDVESLIYASSSSVYGANTKIPLV